MRKDSSYSYYYDEMSEGYELYDLSYLLTRSFRTGAISYDLMPYESVIESSDFMKIGII